MGKDKKRRKIDQFSHLSNLTGIDGVGQSSSTMLDDCLAEFQQPQEQEKVGGSGDLQISQPVPSKNQSKNTDRPSWIRQNSCMGPDEIDVWNQAFLSWSSGRFHASGGGNYPYPPGLLPNIDEELARNFKIKELSSLFLKRFPKKDLRMPVFERWLLDSKLEEDRQTSPDGKRSTSSIVSDPILPIRSSPKSDASQRLLEELVETNQKHNKPNERIQRKDAEDIIAELCRKTNLSCQELLSQRDRYRRQSPLNKGDRIQIEEVDDQERGNKDFVTILYSRKKWKKPFCFKLNRKNYDSLKGRFAEIHDNPSQVESSVSVSSWPPLSLCDNRHSQSSIVEQSFHVIILALLLRYSALSGGQLLEDLRGGGMQGAIHSDIFDVLKNSFGGLWLEGFASPFNATLPRFASAFPDLDWHFGAVGSFFDCHFGGTSNNETQDTAEYCEANPPFSVGIIEAMAEHMFAALSQAEKNHRKLSFAVVVPSGVDRTKTIQRSQGSSSTEFMNEAIVKRQAQQSFELMVSSRYCTKHIRLKAREHGYVEGSQHLRPTMYKTSSYDTSVIILQTSKAKSTSVETNQLEGDIRRAFVSRHESELRKRKAAA
ncbi:phosphorylated CTD interacting factor 1 WW domain containing protein [Nitzschia inconspicua]|uniref:Phosphorylated CTD interacting factor 1 WW domain containing protein n=1 Tax=Nitzschia inconspicua TaxID=303405 RepID=A0A9K3LKD0_9STRA|nr:phosphorylated CTD interacting factor 1 WW domain containing protein [Nitzschia inconspicua]